MTAVPSPRLPTKIPPAVVVPRSHVERLAGRLGLVGADRVDREFLPAHLEVLETPPSPLALALTWTIALFFLGLVTWSVLARIDIYATAQGRVQPSGRSKVVQPYETGKVSQVLVANGDAVRAGQVLVTLDASEAVADEDSRRADLGSLDAQIARRRAEIVAVRGDPAHVPEPDFPHSASAAIEAQERSAMRTDVEQYASARNALLSQLSENAATQARLTSSVAARERLLAILRERTTMKETLVTRQAGTRAAVLDASQQVEQASAELATDVGTLAETRAASESLRRKVEQLTSETVAKQDQSLAEAMEKRAVAVQDVLKASIRKGRLSLASPIDGTVQQVAVSTIGQVVTAGQALMVIVPSSGSIEMEAMVPGRDVGFVVQGQRAVVKLDAFPFTRYGSIEGEVVHVSRDAVNEREAGAASDPVASSRGQGVAQPGSTADTQNLVYPVTVRLDRSVIEADGRTVNLTPGMTATVEVRTGDRRVVDYVLSPMRETTSGAGHER